MFWEPFFFKSILIPVCPCSLGLFSSFLPSSLSTLSTLFLLWTPARIYTYPPRFQLTLHSRQHHHRVLDQFFPHSALVSGANLFVHTQLIQPHKRQSNNQQKEQIKYNGAVDKSSCKDNSTCYKKKESIDMTTDSYYWPNREKTDALERYLLQIDDERAHVELNLAGLPLLPRPTLIWELRQHSPSAPLSPKSLLSPPPPSLPFTALAASQPR